MLVFNTLLDRLSLKNIQSSRFRIHQVTDIIVSQATNKDIQSITQLLEILFTQEADFEPQPEKQAQAIADIISHPEKGHFLLLRHQQQIIGAVSLLYIPSTAMGGQSALLEDMIIRPDFRGKGYGRQLLNAAVEFAQQQGCLRLTLLTDKSNTIAQKMYQQLGFEYSAMLPMRLVF